ncbi:MAG: hypothetical protein CFE21_18545, partial [Bacteroidetes bacterium B1(2017)]
MRNFTSNHFLNTPDLKNEKKGNPFKAFSAFLISFISLIINLAKTHLQSSLRQVPWINKIKLSMVGGAFAFFATFVSLVNVSFAQNAPLGEDKYYLLVGELLWNGTTNTARTDVYQYTTGGGLTGCSLPGGGGEGMVVDPTKNLAYIATCCDVGQVRIYDYNTATFLTPIQLPAGEDILDISISGPADNYGFVYVSTYKNFYKISTTSRSVVAVVPKTSLVNNTTADFWGSAVNNNNTRVFFSTNWRKGSGTSTIESLPTTFTSTSTSTLFATAPSGFHYRGIIFDATGNLWAVAAHDNNSVPDRIYKYSSSGTLLNTYLFPTPIANSVPATGKVDPYDLAFGPDQNLYVTTFAGDCVTKFNVTNNTFSTYLQYTSGVGGKSITFIGGNFKCICTSPVLNIANLTQTSASCNGAIPNNDATVTIDGLVYSSSDIVKGDINEGNTFGQTPIYGASSNKTLGSGQSSFTFTNLKPNTSYTIRVWSGKDACYSDLTFTTNQGVCFTCVCTSNNLSVNGDMQLGNPPSSWTAPQGQWGLGTGSSTGNFGVLNNSDFNSDYYAYQDIALSPGAKVTFDALASTHAVSTVGAIAEMYLEFYNGSTLLATSSKSNTTVSYNGTLVALNTIKFVAPNNTTMVRIVAHSKGRALKYDNVVLTRCYDQAVNLVKGTVVNPACNSNTGSISVVGSGGSGDYEYRINNGAWGTSSTFSNLSGTLAGTNYTIEIRDKKAITCSKTLVVTLSCQCTIAASAGPDLVICNTDQAVIDGTVSGLASCGTTGTTNCASTISSSSGWIADLNTAKVCGDNLGAKLWTKSGQGTSSITLDLGSTLPAGTVVRVNLKLEHCENTTSTQSDAKIEGSVSPGSGFAALQASLLFSHTSYKEYTYSLTTATRYIKVSDNGKCAFRLDYIKYTTPDTYTNAVTYSWSGPGIVGATNTKSVTINAAGSYTFTVTGCDGCTASDVVVVTKNTVTANAGPDKEICLGETVTLTATAVTGATYEWRSSTSSTVISTSQSITVTPTATIDYVLTVFKNGCDESDEVKVTVKPNITVDAGPDKTICNTDELVLDGSVTGVTACGTPGVTNCATTISGSTGWIADLNTAKVCGDNAGAKLWTKSGQGTSSITLDLGSTLPAGTVIRVNLKLEHCENTLSTQSDAKIEASLSSGSGFTSLASSLLFNHTSYKEYTYTLTSSARYIKVSDNGKCALRLDYVKYTTPDTYNNTVTYSWSGPGIVGANNNKSVTVNQPGTYTFTVTGCNGCTGTDVVIVTKNTVSADAGADKVICIGETVTLTATPVSGATYEWRSSTSSTVLSTSATFTVTPTITTDYILTVLKNGCDASDEVKVTVNPKPTITGNIPPVDPICVGTVATLKAGTWTNASTYSWTGPVGFVSQTGVTATTTIPGTYTLLVTSSASCTATATVSLVVNPNPTISVDSKTVCLGGSATLTASGCVGNVTWNTGALGTTLTITPIALGEVVYTATCTNSNGCKATNTGKITTVAKPTVSLGPDVEICLGKSIDLVATGCVGGTLTWNQGITATTTTVTVSPSITTTYMVTCKTSTNDGCIATDEITVKVNPNPTVVLSKVDALCKDANNGTITATGSNGTPLYTFSINGGAFTSTPATSNTFNNLSPNNYSVTVKDSKGCTATSSVAITQPDALVLTKTVVDPNCEKTNGSIDLSVSGGTSPYTYLWSNGATSQDLSNLGEGTFSVTVKDKNNCTSTLSVVLASKDCKFDLALIKQQKTPGTIYKPGDNVTFVITVSNQGTVTAKNVQVSDYIPTGLTLNDAQWSAPVGNITTLNSVIPTLNPGQSITKEITFKINTNAQGQNLINRAEISGASNDRSLLDIDSTPDQIVGNDAGGVPGSPTDDKLDGNGTDDEDDADPAQITVQKYDLALVKRMTTPTQVIKEGDNVSFTITVVNQGTIPATGIQVTDYIPTGMTLNDATWTAVGTNQATKTIAGPLAAGASTDLTVVLKVSAGQQGSTLVNRAEISATADRDNNGVALVDIDSRPDQTVGNDAGGVPGSPTDDKLDGNGTDDEDDADPAQITVQKYDLALVKRMTTP